MYKTIVIMLFAFGAVAFSNAAADEKDLIRRKLDDATTAFEDAMADNQTNLEAWFVSEDENARKLTKGVATQIEVVANERKEFERNGILPKRAPKVLQERRSKETNKLERVYREAIDGYYRKKEDLAAKEVEKALAKLLAFGLVRKKTQIILNQSCELPLLLGKIPNWFAERGTWLRKTDKIVPADGIAVFQSWGHKNPSLVQIVDVTHFTRLIDNNQMKYTLSAKLRSRDGGHGDSAQIDVAFLKTDKGPIIESFQTIKVGNDRAWSSTTNNGKLPKDTRFIRVRLTGSTNRLAQADVLFDDIRFDLEPTVE